MVNIKKVFSILLIVAAIGVSFFSFNLKAHISSAASGTKYIYSASDLVTFANQVNTGSGSYYNYNVYLMNNINMSGVSFPGIGKNDGNNSSRYHFCGTFYGQNYIIKNLSCSGTQDRGLFNYLDGTVRDLTINGGTINCNNNYSAGAFAGSMYSSAKLYNCINLNCNIKGYINNSATLGGLVGYSNSSSATIEKCYSNTTVHTTGYDTVRAGGIAGICTGKSTIKECFVNGTVSAGDGNTNTSFAGGFVGESSANITNCLNKATVKSSAKNSASPTSGTINPLSLINSKLNSEGRYEYGNPKVYYVRQAIPGGDTYSSYTNEIRNAYRGGFVGKQNDGAISYCINTATTNYATSGTTSGQIKKYNLYYRLGWDALIGPTYSLIYMYFTVRTNYYNTFVGVQMGGSVSNCYHPDKTTANYNKVDVDLIYYEREWGDWIKQGTDESNISRLYDRTARTFDTTTDYGVGGAVLEYWTTESEGIDITIGYKEQTSSTWTYFIDVYQIPRPDSRWISNCVLQKSISDMSTITNNSTSVWALDGSTPRLKHFYWADNAVKPS